MDQNTLCFLKDELCTIKRQLQHPCQLLQRWGELVKWWEALAVHRCHTVRPAHQHKLWHSHSHWVMKTCAADSNQYRQCWWAEMEICATGVAYFKTTQICSRSLSKVPGFPINDYCSFQFSPVSRESEKPWLTMTKVFWLSFDRTKAVYCSWL